MFLILVKKVKYFVSRWSIINVSSEINSRIKRDGENIKSNVNGFKDKQREFIWNWFGKS